MKICSKCHRELDESEFYKDSAAKDGLKTKCRYCCQAYKQATKERDRVYNKEYNRRDYVKQQKNQYYANNKDLITQRDNKKKQNDIAYDLNMKTIKSLGGVLAGRAKSSMYFEYFGYTLKTFKEYFETLFTSDMNWSNYGSVWELDHIIPKYKFQFKSVNDKQYKICWSLLNLRPSLVEENRSRPEDGSDIPEETQYRILHQFDRKEDEYVKSIT